MQGDGNKGSAWSFWYFGEVESLTRSPSQLLLLLFFNQRERKKKKEERMTKIFGEEG